MCANSFIRLILVVGYFVHVTTLGEVQEQVLKYLRVMSKPMVLAQIHNVSWSRVYPDVVVSHYSFINARPCSQYSFKRLSLNQCCIYVVFLLSFSPSFFIFYLAFLRELPSSTPPRADGKNLLLLYEINSTTVHAWPSARLKFSFVLFHFNNVECLVTA